MTSTQQDLSDGENSEGRIQLRRAELREPGEAHRAGPHRLDGQHRARLAPSRPRPSDAGPERIHGGRRAEPGDQGGTSPGDPQPATGFGQVSKQDAMSDSGPPKPL